MFGSSLPGSGLWERVIQEILDPLILLVFSAGFLVFVWGIVVFIFNLTESSKREEGKKHMMWGIVGMFIMVGAWGIIYMIRDTLGLDFNNPDIPGSIGAPIDDQFGFFPEETAGFR